jgi:hypothetical protein
MLEGNIERYATRGRVKKPGKLWSGATYGTSLS